MTILTGEEAKSSEARTEDEIRVNTRSRNGNLG